MTILFDGPNKLISLSLGTTSLSLTDLWSRAVDWWLTDDNSKFLFPLKSVGGDPIDESAGTSIPFYFYLVEGWRIRPQEANHTLTVSNGVILVEGGGDPFIDTIGSYNVRLNYQQPVQAITVSTGGGAGGATPAQIWSYPGRSLADPIPTPAQIADAVRLEITDELTHLSSLQNGQGLDSTQATMLLEIYRLYGLDPTKPLVVTQTNRSAGSEIMQSITGNESVTTITRTQ